MKITEKAAGADTGLRWIQPLARPVRRLGVLAGTYNPMTRAHLSLAEAALEEVEAVVLVIPSKLPHKEMFGASLEQRAEMLAGAVRGESRLAAAVSPHGLLAEIADDMRELCGDQVQLSFVCGRDAAERIMNWPYADPELLPTFLSRSKLLVAPRHGHYLPPAEFAPAIQALTLSEELDAVSSTELRRRIACGEPWEMLVPAPIVEMVRAIYS